MSGAADERGGRPDSDRDWTELHLTDQELLDYLEGKLESFEVVRVSGHLAVCPVCQRQKLETEAFLNPASSADALPRSRVGPVFAEFARKRRFPSAWLRSVAVLLLAALFGGAVALLIPGRRWAPAKITLNAPVIELLPDEFVVLSVGPGETGSAASSEPVTLVLVDPATEQGASSVFSVEITKGSRPVYIGTGLKRNELGNFTVVIERGRLSPGDYELTLRPEPHGKPFAHYRFRLR